MIQNRDEKRDLFYHDVKQIMIDYNDDQNIGLDGLVYNDIKQL